MVPCACFGVPQVGLRRTCHFCSLCGTLHVPVIHPTFEPGSAGSLRPSTGADGKTFWSMVTHAPILEVAIFFFFQLVPHHTTFKPYLPSRSLLSDLWYPYLDRDAPWVRTRYGRLSRYQRRDSREGTFNCGNPRTFPTACFFFFFLPQHVPNSPHCSLTIPSATSSALCGTPKGPERHPGYKPGTLGYPLPSDGADVKALVPLGSSGTLLSCTFFVFCFFFPATGARMPS